MTTCFTVGKNVFSLTIMAAPACEGAVLQCGNEPVTNGITPIGTIPIEVGLGAGAMAPLAVGSTLYTEAGTELLQVTGRCVFPATPLAVEAITTTPIGSIHQGTYNCYTKKRGYAIAVVTVSDKGAVGLRQDTSGPALVECICNAVPFCFAQRFMVQDDPNKLQALVADLALYQGYDLVITTGGTGLAPRDTTPEALAPLIQRPLHGFTHAMMATSLSKTPKAILSRQIAGCLGNSIVITLPGSKKAAVENIAAVTPALQHALEKLQGCESDCGA